MNLIQMVMVALFLFAIKMKRNIFIILFLCVISKSISQNNDTLSLIYECKLEKFNFERNIIFNKLLRKEVKKNIPILNLEKKLKIEFYNIETILKVYSCHLELNLSAYEKKSIENFFMSYSNLLFKKGYPALISINRDRNKISTMAIPIKKNDDFIFMNLIAIKNNSFIDEVQVMKLLDLFNSNTTEKVEFKKSN